MSRVGRGSRKPSAPQENEIGFLEKLKDSENVVSILNSEGKGSSVTIVMYFGSISL